MSIFFFLLNFQNVSFQKSMASQQCVCLDCFQLKLALMRRDSWPYVRIFQLDDPLSQRQHKITLSTPTSMQCGIYNSFPAMQADTMDNRPYRVTAKIRGQVETCIPLAFLWIEATYFTCERLMYQVQNRICVRAILWDSSHDKLGLKVAQGNSLLDLSTLCILH